MLVFFNKIYPHGIFSSKRILFFLTISLLYIFSSIFPIEYVVVQIAGASSLLESVSIGSMLQLFLVTAIILLVYKPLCDLMSRRKLASSYNSKFSKEDFYKYCSLHHNVMVRVYCIQIFQEISQYISLGVSKCLETNNEHDVLLRSGIMQTVSSHTLYNKTG